ncbi:MAG TPA: hypothetical protein VLM11_00535 [Streptosporangiaceae bacterium]|nr:hypothetical protein [Streptosporangiaceae bacterium]
MLRFRPAAVLVLVPAAALGVGVFSGPAAARTTPAASGGSAPAPTPAAARTSATVMRVATIRHYGQPGNASGFSAIVATGARQAWAFGGTNPGGPSTPIAARWNGTELTPSALPTGLTGFINDASAPAANDIWAAGQFGRYVLHWDGQRWRIAHQWRTGQITGLTAISAGNVWVFGTTTAGSRMVGTWHFDGTTWRQVTGQAGTIYRASAASRNDLWAIAANSGHDVILRYDGRTWSRVRTGPALNGIQQEDILAVSNRDVWVAGDQVSRTGSPRLELVHWNGIRWSRLGSGPAAWAGRLTPDPNGDVLLTATPATASATGMIVHASARGWGPTIVVADGLGSGVSDVAVVPRTSSLWATGGILTRVGGAAAIWSGPLAGADRADNI